MAVAAMGQQTCPDCSRSVRRRLGGDRRAIKGAFIGQYLREVGKTGRGGFAIPVRDVACLQSCVVGCLLENLRSEVVVNASGARRFRLADPRKNNDLEHLLANDCTWLALGQASRRLSGCR